MVGHLIVLSTNKERRSILFILQVQGEDVILNRRLELEMEVTCLTLGYLSAEPFVLAGLCDDNRRPWLGLYSAAPVGGSGPTDRQIPLSKRTSSSWIAVYSQVL